MAVSNLRTSSSPSNSLDNPPRSNSKPPDINQLAADYLRSLSIGGIQIELSEIAAVEHVCKASPITHTEHAQSAAEFLEVVKRQFASRRKIQPEQERIEIEVPKVILVESPRRVKAFVGFKKEQPLWTWDFRFAQELTGEDAVRIQARLQLLNCETVEVPSLMKAEAAF